MEGLIHLPRMRFMILIHISHFTGPKKLYLDFIIFVIFISARIEHCSHTCISHLYFLFCELHVCAPYTCLEYQPFVHFVFQIFISQFVACLLVSLYHLGVQVKSVMIFL